MTSEQIIALLQLEPHPEGGYFRETYRDCASEGDRGMATAIYFLLRKGQHPRLHRIDAAEMWHHYAGDPLELVTEDDKGVSLKRILGTDFATGQRPQLLVPAHHWQAARTLGEWTLVGCTVSPAFEFSAFELAAAGIEPEGW